MATAQISDRPVAVPGEPSPEQLMSAMRNAHLAGDTQSARRLADWYNRVYNPPEPPKPTLIDRAGNALAAAGRGIAGAGRAAVNALTPTDDQPMPSEATQARAQNVMAPEQPAPAAPTPAGGGMLGTLRPQTADVQPPAPAAPPPEPFGGVPSLTPQPDESPAKQVFDRVLRTVGLKSSKDRPLSTKPSSARAWMQVVSAETGMSPKEMRQAVGGSSGAIESFADGITYELVAGLVPEDVRWRVNNPEMQTTTQKVSQGLGQLVGFIAGLPMQAGEKVVAASLGKFFKTEASDPRIINLAKDMARHGATIGLASGISATGQAIDSRDLHEALNAYADRTLKGAALGGVFGAAGHVLPGPGPLRYLGRAAALNIGVDAVSGTRPNDERSLPEKIRDYGLNFVFALNQASAGSGGASALLGQGTPRVPIQTTGPRRADTALRKFAEGKEAGVDDAVALTNMGFVERGPDGRFQINEAGQKRLGELYKKDADTPMADLVQQRMLERQEPAAEQPAPTPETPAPAPQLGQSPQLRHDQLRARQQGLERARKRAEEAGDTEAAAVLAKMATEQQEQMQAVEQEAADAGTPIKPPEPAKPVETPAPAPEVAVSETEPTTPAPAPAPKPAPAPDPNFAKLDAGGFKQGTAGGRTQFTRTDDVADGVQVTFETSRVFLGEGEGTGWELVARVKEPGRPPERVDLGRHKDADDVRSVADQFTKDTRTTIEESSAVAEPEPAPRAAPAQVVVDEGAPDREPLTLAPQTEHEPSDWTATRDALTKDVGALADELEQGGDADHAGTAMRLRDVERDLALGPEITPETIQAIGRAEVATRDPDLRARLHELGQRLSEQDMREAGVRARLQDRAERSAAPTTPDPAFTVTLEDLERAERDLQAQIDKQGRVTNARTRERLGQVRTAIEDEHNPELLKAVNGRWQYARPLREAIDVTPDFAPFQREDQVRSILRTKGVVEPHLSEMTGRVMRALGTEEGAADSNTQPGERDEPTKLDRTGEPPLEGASTQGVRAPEESGDAITGAGAGGGADVQGDERAGAPRVQAPRGVADDAGALPVPARGSADTGRGDAGSEPVARRDEQPRADAGSDTADADRGGRSDAGVLDRGSPERVKAEQKAADEDRPAAAGTGAAQPPTPAAERGSMFTITPDAVVAEGGAKTKFKNNLAAVRTLRELEAANRPATAAEQAALAKYVGWGGMPQAFAREDGSIAKGWEREAAELRETLSDAEYEAARRSTQDAHYTATEVARAMWHGLTRMGFAGGRVLEPSAGVGNFIGTMPAAARARSQIHLVELDPITSGIARLLYPQAQMNGPMGFQDYRMPDGYYDIATGNPPFGSQRVFDGQRKAISKFSIHNYFFAKSLDGLRPGGILSMVVSSRLLDGGGNRAAREYLAARAELVAAVRLPNNAFLKNAGTEVTTDIVILRKLNEDEAAPAAPWVEVGEFTDARGKTVPLNQYFLDNPEQMLGEFGAYGSMYGPDEPALVARDGQDTGALLMAAMDRLPRDILASVTRAPAAVNQQLTTDLDGVENGSMFLQDDQVMLRRDDEFGKPTAAPVTFQNKRAEERARDMVGLRDIVSELLKAQLTEGVKDSALKALRARLNRAYDAFVKKNGQLNRPANKRIFRDDPTWPQLAALEDDYDAGISPAVAKKTGETARKPSAKKAAIFEKRTQQPYKAPTHAATAQDALLVSLSERGAVDMPYMRQLTGRSAASLADELGERVFEAEPDRWETRDAYLSGNVKAKLAAARKLAQQDARFQRNVDALEAVQPADIEAVDINVKVGAPWLSGEVATDFVQHVLDDARARAVFAPITNTWTIEGRGSVVANQQHGTDRVSAIDVVRAAFSGRDIVVRDRVDENTSVVNPTETQRAAEKVAALKTEFVQWMLNDDTRRNAMVRVYNDTYNTNVDRAYDGAHLKLPGMSSLIELRKHQKDAIWRILQSNTTLLDHVVGAGKTFTMVAAAMELRRMGLARKPVIVVPNHMLEQWSGDFLELYPGARILVAQKTDFEKTKRKELFARIATGDWDAVIVAHSSFGRIRVDPHFEQQFIEGQIRDHDDAIARLRELEGKNTRSVKDVEKARDRLKARLESLFDNENKDDGLTFEQMGIDALFVDEAHEFKNLAFATSMGRIAGVGGTASKKAADLFMKVRSVLSRTGGRNVVFATGTPISNSMAEMFTMQRYLGYEALQAQGLAHFDAWANVFGDVVNDWELSPTGQYKMKARFSRFVNIPELIQQYTAFADVVDNDDIKAQLAAQGKRQPIPKVKGGKPENVVVERSQDQADYIGEPLPDGTYPPETLVYRAEHLPKGPPKKGDDNMLKIMSDARKAALDMRLIDPVNYGDYDGSKTNVAADRITALHKKWKADKGAQLVFIDLSTPKNAVARERARLQDLIERADAGDEAAQETLDRMSPDELEALESQFDVYNDLKAKLIARGIPEKEIAFIHDANTDAQKAELFAKVRTGRVRVLLGSTAKMGAGTNVQTRLVALHHLDAPWRPSDLEQREGRIIRQGNELFARDPDGFEVEILRYATKGTLDSRMWQTIETKARFIGQVRKGTGGERTVEDIAGEASNAAEMKAASSGNPLILEEIQVRQEIRKLEQSRTGHQRDQFRLRDTLRTLQERIERAAKRRPAVAADATQAAAAPSGDAFTITVLGKAYDKRKDAGAAIVAELRRAQKAGQDTVALGTYAGFTVQADAIDAQRYALTLIGQAEHAIANLDPREMDAGGTVQRIVNAARGIPDELARLDAGAAAAKKQIPELEKQVRGWPDQKKLDAAKARHADIIFELRSDDEATRSPDDGNGGTNSLMAMATGTDQPGPNWQPLHSSRGGGMARPASGTITVAGHVVKLPDERNPVRVENIRQMVATMIGPRLYVGKVRGKSRLGFYRENNSEIRTKNWGQVEVLAHELAHYLDKHYTHTGVFTAAYRNPKYRAEVEAVSYTSKPGRALPEGFAEFVRLWATNYPAAQTAAPNFLKRFEEILDGNVVPAKAKLNKLDKDMARDFKRLGAQMRAIQRQMHAWYWQGGRAQGRATSGKKLTRTNAVDEYLQTDPWGRLRQELVDRNHAFKVVEFTLHPERTELGDLSVSPFKQMQIVNGAEGTHVAVIYDGTPELLPDGSLGFSKEVARTTWDGKTEVIGTALQDVWKEVAAAGRHAFDDLMDYFKARRGEELMKQGRERSLTQNMIDGMLKLADKYPDLDFRNTFDRWIEFNQRMLDWYVQMGYITEQQRDAFEKNNTAYVPFHRVIENLETGAQGMGNRITARLTGGNGENTRDIAVNIVEGLYANIRAAMLARARNTLFEDILTSQDGGLFAAPLAPGAEKVTATIAQMADRVAQTMAEVGMTVTDNGIVVNDNPNRAGFVDVKEIAQALQNNPELLTLWTFGHEPTTTGTYVTPAIINGRQRWFEVTDPMLVRSQTARRTFMVNNKIYRTALGAKNTFTRLVTMSPFFMPANMVRDTIEGTLHSRHGFVPVLDSAIGAWSMIRRDENYKLARLNGAMFGSRILGRTEETRARHRLDLPIGSGWDMVAKFYYGVDRVGDLFEMSTRMGEYRKAIQKGKSPAEAAWQARELTVDFGNQGANPIVQFYMSLVPFMRAGLNGLDLEGRRLLEAGGGGNRGGGGGGRISMAMGPLGRPGPGMRLSNFVGRWNASKRRYFMMGALISAFTLALWAYNQDDERYKALTPDQRARYWWFFPDDPNGKPMTIPKPYTSGMIFATLPELLSNYVKDKEGAETGKYLAFALAHELMFGGYPLLITPIFEVATNKDYRDAPIVPFYIAQRQPAYQYRPSTPEIYKRLGKALDVSPLVAQHITRGYLAYAATYVEDLTDAMFWNKEEWGERPFVRNPLKYAAHHFMGQKVPYRTRWTEEYYSLKERIQFAHTTENMLKKNKRWDRARLEGFAADRSNLALSRLEPSLAKLDRLFMNEGERVAQIIHNPKMTRAEKEETIEDYYRVRNATFAKYVQEVDKKLREIESAQHNALKALGD